MPQPQPNVPDYTAPVGKVIGSRGLTDNVNAGHAQVEALTDFAKALPPTAEVAGLPQRVKDLEDSATGGPARRSGTVVKFDVHEALYGPVIGGTFTVDVTDAQPGYSVRADLDSQSSEIVLPSAGFNRAKNSSAFVIGAYNYYIFIVGPDGVIDYLISQRS